MAKTIRGRRGALPGRACLLGQARVARLASPNPVLVFTAMTPKSTRRVLSEALLRIITVLLVAIFVRAGVAKFDDTSGWARAFRFLGLSSLVA